MIRSKLTKMNCEKVARVRQLFYDKGNNSWPKLDQCFVRWSCSSCRRAFSSQRAYQNSDLDLVLLWLKLHLWGIPCRFPSGEQSFKIRDCWSVWIFQRFMQLIGSRHCFICWRWHRPICFHWLHRHPCDPGKSWPASSSWVRWCGGMRSGRMRSGRMRSGRMRGGSMRGGSMRGSLGSRTSRMRMQGSWGLGMNHRNRCCTSRMAYW